MIHCCLRVSSCVSLKSAQKLGLLITAAFSLALLAACSRGSAEGPQVIPAMPVKVETVQDQPIGDASEYVATIKSRHSATIMSDVEGWIFDIRVHSGQLVKKGDTLMEIDPRLQQATVSNYDSQKRSKEAALAGPSRNTSALRRWPPAV